MKTFEVEVPYTVRPIDIKTPEGTVPGYVATCHIHGEKLVEADRDERVAVLALAAALQGFLFDGLEDDEA